MRFQYHFIDSLPRLAWLADVDQADNIVHVYHGVCVEAKDNFFIEGAWNSSFRKGDFTRTDCIFGSGAALDSTDIVFVSSASTTDFIYYKDNSTQSGQVVVSNSLAFLLAFLNDALDAKFLNYAEINQSIKGGINDFQATIPTAKGDVRRLMYRNLRVSSTQIGETEKRAAPHFQSFSDYRSYLAQNVKQTLENARDEHRKFPMQVLSTQSTGYDTTVINAIAANFGIDAVFTCPEAKEKGSFYMGEQIREDSDDGAPICELLGLNCIRIRRRTFEEAFSDEHLYYAALHENQDTNLREIHSHITNTALLLTGVLGEIWNTSATIRPDRMHTIDSNLKRWDLSGHGLSEVRLHAGFVHVPVPYIGAGRRAEILQISDSREMQKWRLEGQYDRPIARRIGEEAGIPRAMFGQNKLATVVDFPVPSVPYDATLRSEYFDFLTTNRLLGTIAIRLFPAIHSINNYICWKNPQKFFQNYRQHPITYYLGRAITKLMGGKLQIRPLWRHLDGSLYCFCVNKTLKSYRTCLNWREK